MIKSVPVKVILCVLLVAIGLLSVLLAAPWAGSEKTFAAITTSIDSKLNAALSLAGGSAAASTLLTVLPGDVATPIATQLAELTDYFLLVICVLLAEKFLGPIIALGVFRFVVPVVCALAIVLIFKPSQGLKRFTVKTFITGLCFLFLVPVSTGVADLIYSNYQESIDAAVTQSQTLADQASQASTEKSKAAIAQAQPEEEEETGVTGFISGIVDFFDDPAAAVTKAVDDVVDTVSLTAESLKIRATEVLTSYMQSLAVFVVTSCIIPLLTLLLFIWIIKMITGLEINPPRPRFFGKQHEEQKALNDHPVA